MENTPVYFVGSDIMAYILLYLNPPEIRNIISIPLSKHWQEIYTYPQDIWKILCSSKLFYAKFDIPKTKNSSNSVETFPLCNDLGVRHKFGIYRFLYTDRSKIKVKKAKIGISSLTIRLLGTSKDGTPGYLKLPLSFALFSILNWMSALSDVLGIQISISFLVTKPIYL